MMSGPLLCELVDTHIHDYIMIYNHEPHFIWMTEDAFKVFEKWIKTTILLIPGGEWKPEFKGHLATFQGIRIRQIEETPYNIREDFVGVS